MRVFLSRVHVRLVAKSTAPFQTGGGGKAKEGRLEDERKPKRMVSIYRDQTPGIKKSSLELLSSTDLLWHFEQ